ncbi:metallophosphoesterase [Erythrobacter sp. SCSIO 43205]|uniref:metallophosphoesterase family protein n=1 Tax=Erythrobacter sp. SCSIO 43205 TaxID=2779361 RepID=UPI001CA8AE5B|nr:metallophosphoesterase [Erythrobacter sp. SCSIO 43205]UAB78451.1 metallophosphoesterase [Erythrobacter sp. SCSIO 43205]
MTTRLFHVSDVHFGVEDRACLDQVAKAVREERPDALVCTGDLTQRATHQQYKEAADWFRSLGVPIWLNVGNHDMPYKNLWERFTDPYRRYNALREAVAVDSFETPDVVLVGLKSTVRIQPRFPWSDGFVTEQALSETQKELHALQGDDRHIVVTTHHPLLGPKGEAKNPTIGGDAAFAALGQAGAQAVLSGHIHKPLDEIRELAGARIRMLGSGTLSSRLRHGAGPSYRALTFTKGEPIASELRELEPSA